jgi:hypothetical protein
MMKNILTALVVFFSIAGCKEENPVQQHDEQFIQIHYEYGFRDELNTFDGYIQKDLVVDGTIRVPFWLSKDEQIIILHAVNETQFFSFPDTIHREANIAFNPDPSPDKLRIKYNGKEKNIVWFYPMQDSSQYTLPLHTLKRIIESVIDSNSIYQKLPPAHGAYL